ncbi:MAG: DUF72 domain-containing protein [Bacteroidota bacterium]|nr:DUF72 domain-containing protein [Bacteroidota bacterium]
MTAMPNCGELFVGTSGWSYQHWCGCFYPSEIQPFQYLEYYITQFDCVELNASFYHLPFKATVAGWMRRTPESFRFCSKMSRFITHQKRLVNCDEALENYFQVFDCLKPKLGPVLVQLPPNFHYDKELFIHFADLLTNRHPDYRFAVEIRDGSWLNDDLFDLLNSYSIGFVISDAGGKFPFAEIVTSDFVYIRFHGREQLYASDYTMQDLVFYAEKIRSWLNEGKDVWAFFNNDYGGFAPKNALNIRELVYLQ